MRQGIGLPYGCRNGACGACKGILRSGELAYGDYQERALHPQEKATELIAFHSEFLRHTPDELDTTIAFLYSPEGTPLVGVIAVYAGSLVEGERVARGRRP